jgi:hypothetical protein
LRTDPSSVDTASETGAANAFCEIFIFNAAKSTSITFASASGRESSLPLMTKVSGPRDLKISFSLAIPSAARHRMIEGLLIPV